MKLSNLKNLIELSKLFDETDSCSTSDSLGIKIVILQRGWVVVGNLFKTGKQYRLTNGFVIRKWGTTKGLGEIAEKGPTGDTVLDKITECGFHELTVVATLGCEKSKWADYVKN